MTHYLTGAIDAGYVRKVVRKHGELTHLMETYTMAFAGCNYGYYPLTQYSTPLSSNAAMGCRGLEEPDAPASTTRTSTGMLRYERKKSISHHLETMGGCRVSERCCEMDFAIHSMLLLDSSLAEWMAPTKSKLYIYH